MPYLRLLGRRKDACPLPLGNSETPVVGRLAKEEERLSGSDREKLAQDIFAADIYHMTVAQKTGMPQKNRIQTADGDRRLKRRFSYDGTTVKKLI